jgi:predicted transcriptional regulator
MRFRTKKRALKEAKEWNASYEGSDVITQKGKELLRNYGELKSALPLNESEISSVPLAP